jgi:hypothetical protein
MKFFNKKEDVLDIQLTQYGKHLLSIGELEPMYYAFFDDDILYDSEYAGVADEVQNEIQPRIEEDTPRVRTQYVFSGREAAVKQSNSRILSGEASIGDKVLQQTPDKNYALSAPLGNSDHGAEHMPAWEVKVLTGEISETIAIKEGAHAITKIPQLDFNVIKFVTTTGVQLSGSIFETMGDELAEFEPDTTDWIPLAEFDDGTYLGLEGEEILLEINERNTPFTNENYELEVFMIEMVDEHGRIVTKNTDGSETTLVEKLTPLSFVKPWTNIINNVLTDDVPPPFLPEINPSYAEYFIQVDVDGDIPDVVLCKAKPEARKAGVLTNEDELCCPEQTEDVDRAVDGLYDPLLTEDDGPFGEDCD